MFMFVNSHLFATKLFTAVKRVFITIVLPFLFAARIYATGASTDSGNTERELMRFSGNIHQFNSIFPQEKVYLEFDNTAYFTGETIWFKAFVTHATTLKRAPSKVLYVDLLAPNGKVVRQHKLKIVAGQCDGAFTLLDVGTEQSREKRGITYYPSGFYEIRAYTQNMLDFSHEAIFSRVIPVYTKPPYEGGYDESTVNVEQDDLFVRSIRNESDEIDKSIIVSFYPEGGDLVEGIPCNIAFKATGSDGFPIEGALIIPHITDSIFTLHDGMGSFTITPHGGETVRFITAQGNSSRFSLPKPVKKGYVMTTSCASDTTMTVSIRRTPDLIGEPVALAVTCRGDLIHFEQVRSDDSADLTIDCSGWPLGVCRMTLYNKDGRILSSRSLFHNNREFRNPTIALSTDSLSREPFSREIINLRLTDREGNPIRDRFCLSVRDYDDYGTGMTENIMTNLLLSSDLKGYIHDPAWYLKADDSIHREALNLLTLIQGWERYEWRYMTGIEQFRERHRIEDSLTINGWLLSYLRRQPVKDVVLFAAITPNGDKKKFEPFKYRTDSSGYFGFNMTDFYGSGKMAFRVTRFKKSGKPKHPTTVRIRFERADKPTSRSFYKQETDLEHNIKRNEANSQEQFVTLDDDLKHVVNKDLGIVLDNVDIEEKHSPVRYDEFIAYDIEEETEYELDLGEYTDNIYGYFKEHNIPLIEGEDSYSIMGRPILWSLHTRNKPYKSYDESPMTIDLIDVRSIVIYDRPMTRRQASQFLPHMAEQARQELDIEWFAKNVTDDSLYYVVDVLMKEDYEMMSRKEIRDLSDRTTTVKGFSLPVEFYAPQYPEGPITGDYTDKRRTLYWEPNVITDEQGYARLEFYNNSYSRRYTITGAGLTATGTPFMLNMDW